MEALFKIKAELEKGIGKDKENKFSGYSYVSYEGLMKKLNPLLNQNKVFILPSLLKGDSFERQGKNWAFVTYEYKVFIDNKEVTVFQCSGEAVDKNGDKAIYKAITGCHKYAYMSLFGIASTDDPEADEDTDKPDLDKYGLEAGPQVRDPAAQEQYKANKKNLIPEIKQLAVDIPIGSAAVGRLLGFSIPDELSRLTLDKLQLVKDYMADIKTRKAKGQLTDIEYEEIHMNQTTAA